MLLQFGMIFEKIEVLVMALDGTLKLKMEGNI